MILQTRKDKALRSPYLIELMINKSISTQALKRLPIYLNYLKSLPSDGYYNISATMIAEALRLNDVQVRKDLALISTGGRPKVGYITKSLITDLEKFLGSHDAQSAVIAGAGSLGSSLLTYKGFLKYGLDLVAAFDTEEALIGTIIGGKKVLSIHKLEDLCSRMKVRIGIIAVPESSAQQVCDQMVSGGILAIWNFAPIHLKVPEHIIVQNEDMAFSLASLSKQLTLQFESN